MDKKILFSFFLIACFFQNIFAQPTITSFTPTNGKVGTLVTITGTNLTSPTVFTIGSVPAIIVSNIGTTLVGMVMPGATTNTISITTTSGVATSSGNFTITSTLYPQTQQGSKLVGTGAIGATVYQGNSIAISANGNTAICSGYNDSNGIGATWVFTRSGNTWTQQGVKLIGTGAVGTASQGVSVSLSADGNTAIIGGYNDNAFIGAAWIFTRNGSTWAQQGAKLIGTGAVGAAHQGSSVSISADGNTAIVGGYNDSSGKGAVWVYTRIGSAWTQQGGKLVGTGTIGNSYQGASASISANGNTAIVGGFNDSTGKGAVWVFTRNGSTWTQQGAKLVGTGVIGNAMQGNSLSLSADGNTAIVGGFGDNSFLGAAWIFTRNISVWTQQGSKLIGTGAVGAAHQGNSVSISADGNTAIVGGSCDSSNVGAAWVYIRSGGVWAQYGAKLLGTSAIGAGNQGAAVSISADGNTTIVGGCSDSLNKGATWVYVSSALLPIQLTSFDAKLIVDRVKGIGNGEVLCTWQTASELNNDYFEVERSTVGSPQTTDH